MERARRTELGAVSQQPDAPSHSIPAQSHYGNSFVQEQLDAAGSGSMSLPCGVEYQSVADREAEAEMNENWQAQQNSVSWMDDLVEDLGDWVGTTGGIAPVNNAFRMASLGDKGLGPIAAPFAIGHGIKNLANGVQQMDQARERDDVWEGGLTAVGGGSGVAAGTLGLGSWLTGASVPLWTGVAAAGGAAVAGTVAAGLGTGIALGRQGDEATRQMGNGRSMSEVLSDGALQTREDMQIALGHLDVPEWLPDALAMSEMGARALFATVPTAGLGLWGFAGDVLAAAGVDMSPRPDTE